MDELLTVSSSRHFSRNDELLVPAEESNTEITNESLRIDCADDVIRILKAQPTLIEFSKCLKWLNRNARKREGFNIRIPNPKATVIVHALVHRNLTDYWHLLRDDKTHVKEKGQFQKVITSLAGIGALVHRLEELNAASQNTKESKLPAPTDPTEPIVHVIEVLEEILSPQPSVSKIAEDLLHGFERPMQRNIALKELASLLASGRVLSVCAEAVSHLSNRGSSEDHWICDGKSYCQWLGRSMLAMATQPDEFEEDRKRFIRNLFSKGLSLGYRDQFIGALFHQLIIGNEATLETVSNILASVTELEQSIAIYSLLVVLSSRSTKEREDTSIGGRIALLRSLTATLPHILDSLVDWLTDRNSGSINVDTLVHRVVICLLSKDIERLEMVAERLLSTFADRLSIEHTPILHQEVITQDLLLVIGYLHRNDKIRFTEFAKSGKYINAISNRLAASSSQSRFLGMVVGMAISELKDDPDKIMKFDMDMFDEKETAHYRDLIKVDDRAGSISDLKRNIHSVALPESLSQKAQIPVRHKLAQAQTSKIVAIEEVNESESEDDDLPIYEKPDSDREDSDEDPTLIQRNKASAPVYIPELIKGLRDSENYDRNKVALYTASDLIRRKARFGTEVIDYVEELASLTAGLRDSFNIEFFEEKRLQAMIAIIVAQPLNMSKWFSSHLFIGDYSMSQRASILTALSLAARELAGYRKEDAQLTGAHVDIKDMFPSKRLPPGFDPRFAVTTAPINALTTQMERAVIKPMAAKAADKASGPDILKVRTFSSRMEVEKRKRPITNELAKIVADGFFFPLTSRYTVHMQAYGSSSSFATPFLLAHFLKTLALITSASGQSTLSLPALTTGFWGFLLPLRFEAAKAMPVLEAILFCFLTILEINGNDHRRLAHDHSQELLDTQNWAQSVFDNTRGGEKEGEKVRTLAASVMVKCSEVVEEYQQLLIGAMSR